MNESFEFVEPQKCWKTMIRGLPPNQKQYKIFQLHMQMVE
jgi:hypothetical protein